MTDVQHTFGSDLTVDSSGDLQTSSGTQEGEERVIRRLLTNPGDYIWHLAYGAGLARFIGGTMASQAIAAVARRQMFMENVVARDPPPVIGVQNTKDGYYTLSIKYADSGTGDPVTRSLPLSADG